MPLRVDNTTPPVGRVTRRLTGQCTTLEKTGGRPGGEAVGERGRWGGERERKARGGRGWWRAEGGRVRRERGERDAKGRHPEQTEIRHTNLYSLFLHRLGTDILDSRNVKITT